MKEGKLVVAFDTDDTLLIPNIAQDKIIGKVSALGYGDDYKEPAGYKHIENVNAYKWFQRNGCHMIVWSGIGIEWAERWSKEFGLLPDEIREKKKYDDIDISIDDCNVDLAQVNMKVKRINNSISRAEWNKTKR